MAVTDAVVQYVCNLCLCRFLLPMSEKKEKSSSGSLQPRLMPILSQTPLVVTAVKLRIRATNNVAKITNVMKMVASSKLKSVEDMLAKGKAFGVRGTRVWRSCRARAPAFAPLTLHSPSLRYPPFLPCLQQSLLNALALKEEPRTRDEKDADSALVRLLRGRNSIASLAPCRDVTSPHTRSSY